jgi:hypothetical protein
MRDSSTGAHQQQPALDESGGRERGPGPRESLAGCNPEGTPMVKWAQGQLEGAFEVKWV